MKEEPVPFPLYHGTSSLFLDSILSRGLGGFDPIGASRAVECLRAVKQAAGERLQGHPGWMSLKETLLPMCDQRQTGGGFNYRHGNTYLSPAKITAIRYALSNPHGSELLSECIKLLAWFSGVDPSEARSIERQFPEVASLARRTDGTHILIRLPRVFPSQLRTEQGEAPGPMLVAATRAIRECGEAAVQQKNFRLVLAVPLALLDIFRVHPRGGSTSNPSYELTPVSVS